VGGPDRAAEDGNWFAKFSGVAKSMSPASYGPTVVFPQLERIKLIVCEEGLIFCDFDENLFFDDVF
jgi:hypothetical protein